MKMKRSGVLIGCCLLITAGLIACGSGPATETVSTGDQWRGGAMAAAANPHAVDAAMAMLARGGHAVDAAIAAHAVLGLVEPQSSGLGGGAVMLVYEREADSLAFHDGRETAPAAATADMFMRDGEVMGFFEAWQSGLAVGVPGTVALYEAAHKEHGKLPWKELFEPAIELAEQGFVVSPRLAGFLPRVAARGRLDENPATAAYFFPDGKALQAGQRRDNPQYADTLRLVATEGAAAFYSGELARAIVEAVRQEPNPGTLSEADIAAYQAVRREAVCGGFRDLQLCTPGPPSSGATQIMMSVIYDQLAAGAESQADRVAAFVDAQRLAYADRDYFFGDPDQIDIPLTALLDPQYLRHRAANPFAPGEPATHGDPQAFLAARDGIGQWGSDSTGEVPGTSHLSIVDSQGNAVSMTATVEAPFGSSRWAGGFLLNNEMTDFARELVPGGELPANAIAPGKRPRTSMSPLMIFGADDQLMMVTGSPGGNSIPAYVFKSVIAILDWDLELEEAVAFPNIVARGDRVRVEVNVPPGQDIADDLKRRGYDVQERQGENSGLHVILVDEDQQLSGAADPRREGTVGSLPAVPGP